MSNETYRGTMISMLAGQLEDLLWNASVLGKASEKDSPEALIWVIENLLRGAEMHMEGEVKDAFLEWMDKYVKEVSSFTKEDVRRKSTQHLFVEIGEQS